MPTRKGFVQGYNTQVAVTADQVIVAVQVGQATTDQGSFVPMMHAAQEAAALLHAHTGSDDQLIGTVLADAGYASDANLAAPGPARLIALGKNRDQFRAALVRLTKMVFRAPYADLAAMEDELRASDLQWTILRPPRLANKPLTGRYRTAIGRNLRHGLSVSRADLAHAMLAVVTKPETIGQSVGIAY